MFEEALRKECYMEYVGAGNLPTVSSESLKKALLQKYSKAKDIAITCRECGGKGHCKDNGTLGTGMSYRCPDCRGTGKRNEYGL
jgi:DnaJ-class molecular chaperone